MSGLEHLWAGWRSEYIASVTEEPDASPPPGSDAGPGPSPADTGGGPAGSERDGGEDAGSERDSAVGEDQPAERCVFCRILTSGADDAETHIVWRDPSGLAVALLNAYPYGTGHLMVMPVRHTGALENLRGAESAVLWAGVTDAVRAIKAAYRPDGLNVGANLGRAGGAGVPGHLHIHVLPRWEGDTNFMTTIAETRVLPEALSVTADKLRRGWGV